METLFHMYDFSQNNLQPPFFLKKKKVKYTISKIDILLLLYKTNAKNKTFSLCGYLLSVLHLYGTVPVVL